MAPCAWPVEPLCCASWDAATPEQRAAVAAVTTEILWAITGRRFGVCPVTVRPCKAPCDTYGRRPAYPYVGGAGAGSFSPALVDGAWINGCGQCVTDCGCGPLCEVVLPGPVDQIIAVRLDGDVVPAAGYRVDDHRRLVRTDGECWPYCQHLDQPDTEPGTFSVTYGLGIPVPAAGRYAAGVYACELIKACVGEACRLPRRVTQVTRQGVTWQLLDPFEFLENGLTGLYEVDAWVKAVNPDGLSRAARVYSPDVRPPRRTTWPT